MSAEPESLAAFQTGGGTHPGHVRENNEDDLVVRPEIGLWAVADGMGGHEAGAFASHAVAGALSEIDAPASAAALLDACNRQIAKANESIRAFARSRGGAIVGTTAAVLLALDGRFACVWCGDSRIYLIRRGVLRQVTRDHSELQEFIDRGVLTPDEARTWPNRNVLTRAIGVSDAPETEMAQDELQSGDVFVLCSDGLTTHVDDGEIAMIAARRPPESGCRELIDLALSRGGRDNVTVVVVHYRPDITRRKPQANADAASGSA